MSETHLFILTASIFKDIPGGNTRTVILGYRRLASEDEAKGSFLTHVQTTKPDYVIEQLLCLEVPELPAEDGKLRTQYFQDRSALWEALLDSGPMCRDCADEDGRCPTLGRPCDPQVAALERIAELKAAANRAALPSGEQP